MVKGISKQVIVVQSPDREIFDQAIFILSDDAVKRKSYSDEKLIYEANRILKAQSKHHQSRGVYYGMLYFVIGSFLTGMVWLLTAIV